MKKLFFIIVICFMSCQNDVENITIKGKVIDKHTKEALPNVELSIVCWYYGNSPDESYSGQETKTIITNENGEYEITFDKGAFLEVKVDRQGFKKYNESEYINGKSNTINIKIESL